MGKVGLSGERTIKKELLTAGTARSRSVLAPSMKSCEALEALVLLRRWRIPTRRTQLAARAVVHVLAGTAVTTRGAFGTRELAGRARVTLAHCGPRIVLARGA